MGTVFKTIPIVDSLLGPLAECLLFKPLPLLSGHNRFNDMMLSILSLPMRFDGLGIVNPMTWAHTQHSTSLHVTDPFVSLITRGSDDSLFSVLDLVDERKNQLHQTRENDFSTQYWALLESAHTHLQRCLRSLLRKVPLPGRQLSHSPGMNLHCIREDLWMLFV